MPSPQSVRFTGLVAAPFTPFRPDLSLNTDVIPRYARYLEQIGVSAVFICGTTGEGSSLTIEERKRCAEGWMAAAGKLRVIVHVGHTCLQDAREIARHADSLGAHAIGAVAPYFFKPRTSEELVDWCSRVAGAAPKTPFYYYNIPSMTGVSLPVAPFLAAVRDRIPTLAGVKYTWEDLDDYSKSAAFGGGRYDLLFGRDEMLLEGLGLGAAGAVGSTYNYAAPLYQRIITAFQAGNKAEARRLQDVAIEMIRLCNGTGVTHLAASKALMSLAGVDCGPTRPPLEPIQAPKLKDLKRQLDGIGYADFAPPFRN